MHAIDISSTSRPDEVIKINMFYGIVKKTVTETPLFKAPNP
jgi:hypothetical protein